MRPLSFSEKLLLSICGLVALLVGHAIAFKQYQTKERALLREIDDLEQTGATKPGRPSQPKDQAALWEKRLAWLDATMPKMESSDQAQSDLLEWMQATARERTLFIRNQNFVKPNGSPYYQEVAVAMRVGGPEREVYQWVADMQSPEKFQAVKHVQITPDGNANRPRADCQITLARWFKP